MNTKNDVKYHRDWLRVHRYGFPIEGLPPQSCPGCGVIFVPRTRKQKFCHKACGTVYRRKTVYGNVYTNKCRGKSAEAFIAALLSHKNRKEFLTLDYMMGIYHAQDGKCALSGEQMTHITGKGRGSTNISIDRIDSSKGYVPGNVQLVCAIINCMKNEHPQEEFIKFCQKVVDKNQNPLDNRASNLRIESKKKNRGRKK